MNSLRYAYGFIVILILQLLCCEFITVWPVLYIAVIPLMIVILPSTISTYIVMLLGFAIGLLTDALSDGVLGLNAASCTLAGAFKNMITQPMRRYDIQSDEFNMNSGEFRSGKLVLLLVLVYLLFFTAYVLIDGAGVAGWIYIVLRIIFNVAVNTAIAYLLIKLWIRRFF